MHDDDENIRLTDDQQYVFDKFKAFIKNNQQKVFILNGHAGTGKTTLIRFFIDELRDRKLNYNLMASTGRAAKILTNITGTPASTVHSIIYSLEGFNQDIEEIAREEDETGVDETGQLVLIFGLTPKSPSKEQYFYIVDEASMIADVEDKNPTQARFGDGKLLSNLLKYDPEGKFIFVGDECQLPPVGQEISPALSPGYFKQTFDIDVVECKLTQIIRQQADNSIIQAAQQLRNLYANPPKVKWGKLPLGNHKHIRLYLDFKSMKDSYLATILGRVYEKSTFISSTNRKCYESNKMLRESLGFRGPLHPGDLLLVTQNNQISGLLNGDLVVVEQVRGVRHHRAGLSFLQVEVRELVTERRVSQLLIEDILYSRMPNLTQIEQKALFIDFYRRMKDLGIKQEDPRFNERLYDDVFLNALRCVFGYTLTCHKAQGGEWDEVFLDIARNLMLEAQPAAYQWAYTAVTRAKKQLHIVDDFYIEKD